MVSIAREILLHDKLRLAITVVSLGFAIVMIVYDLGMFFGVTEESVNLVDRAGADLWLLQADYDDLFSPSLLPERLLDRVRGVDGVETACTLDTLMGDLTLGDAHQVQIVGLDPDCSLIQPWQVVAGDAASLREIDAAVVDDFVLRNDPARVGDRIEVNGQTLRIAAVTRHNKGFTTPYVYVNRDTFLALGGPSGQHAFLAVRLAPGADEATVATQLAALDTGARVMETPALRRASIQALVAQGVGMIFAVVFIGVLVGLMIITTTVYTATVEQLRNFAILKALGATRWQLWRIVLEQAILQTVISFALGLLASLGLNWLVETMSGIRAVFPVGALVASLAAMILLAIVGSLLSVRRAVTADPMLVFRA